MAHSCSAAVAPFYSALDIPTATVIAILSPFVPIANSLTENGVGVKWAENSEK